MIKISKFLSVFTFLLSVGIISVTAQDMKQVQGVTLTGVKGITKKIADVIAYEKAHPMPANFKAILRNEVEGPAVAENPDAPQVSQYGTALDRNVLVGPGSNTPTQSAYSNFLAIWGSYATVTGRESPYTPPDNCGDVGLTQIVSTANTRMKVFAKPSVTGTASTTPTGTSTTTLTALVNIDLNVFFTNSSLGISGISDPHVRFDRLSQRWFIVAIDINHNTNNYCCVAVSSSATITSSSSFQIFYFNVSGTGGSSADFYDYPTLGVDKNSLYIGGNMFANGSSFSGSNMWVVNKANLIAGTLTVTGFPHSTTSTNMYTPQGVHNDDPGATQGYFIGASQTLSSKLVIRRVSYSGSTPSLSADISITTPTTAAPKTVPTKGGVAIDGGDQRPFAAMIKKNKITGVADLWVAQCTKVTKAGVGSTSGDRDGAIWFEIGNLSSTPSIVQSAILSDKVNAKTSAINYTYPTIAMSGQGHNAMGFTTAGSANYAQAGGAGRYRTDAAATLQAPVNFTTTTSSYNPGANRWGDYTQTVVDPTDDMTMWIFSEYAPTTNAWGVRAIQLKAPPPATPSISTVPPCGASTVTINGTSTNNSEFFDPGADAGGPGFNHIAVSVSGPSAIAVSNVTFVSPTQITATFTVPSGAATGTYTVTVTNPDGQTATTTFNRTTACAKADPILPEAVTKPLISQVYPNPTTSLVNFQLELKSAQTVYAHVYDASGKKLFSQKMNLNAGINTQQIALGRYTSGIYVVEFRDAQNNIIEQTRVVKQ